MDDRADKPKQYEIAMSSQLQKLVSILKGHNFQVNLELWQHGLRCVLLIVLTPWVASFKYA